MNSTHGGKVFAVARKLGVAPEEILDFSASINPLGPPPGVRECGGRRPSTAWCTIPTATARSFPRPWPTATAAKPANICVANGSTELIYLLPRLVAGKRALARRPLLLRVRQGAAQAGWQCDYLFLRERRRLFPVAHGTAAKSWPRGIDLLFLCNPGNPTGRLYSPEEVGGLLALCRERHPSGRGRGVHGLLRGGVGQACGNRGRSRRGASFHDQVFRLSRACGSATPWRRRRSRRALRHCAPLERQHPCPGGGAGCPGGR